MNPMKVDEYEMTAEEVPASWIEALYELNEEKEKIDEDEDGDGVDTTTTIFPWHMCWDQYIAFLEEIVEESRRRMKTA